jgi:hypothetical protein
MFNEVVSEFPGILLAVGISALVLIGYGERHWLGRADLACLTWFLGLILTCALLAGQEWLGTFRWIVAGFIWVAGIFWLISYYKNNPVAGRNRLRF